MAQSVKRIYEFDSFQLDVPGRRLLQRGEPVLLAAKAIDVLLVLVENRGRVVEKEELMQKVWADSFVEEANLTVHMSALRKALGENRNAPRYIATISGRGYRFLAEVKEIEELSSDSLSAEALFQPGDSSLPGSLATQIEARANQDAVLPSNSGSDLIIEEHTLSRITLEGAPPQGLKLSAKVLSATRNHRVLAVFLFALACGFLFLLYQWLNRPFASEPTIKSIAVLPFKPINREASNEILELGMAETLITKFASTGRLIVRPTAAVKKYGNPEQDPLAAGRELGVDAVLDGSLQRLGDRLRITVHLINVRTGLPLWAETYDQKFADIFAVQDKVSAHVAEALTLKLTGEQQQQLSKHPTNNPEAYQVYLQGRYFWNKRTQEGYRKATDYFNEALKIDPEFALAYSGLADSYLFTAEQLPAREVIPKAREAALRALEIDGSLAEAYTSLAKIKQHWDWDWAGAERDFERAISLNPNYPTAHHWYAQCLMDKGRAEEAFQEIKRAKALDPFSLIINTDAGSLYQDARQYDQAILAYRKVIEMDANFARVHFELGRALEQKGLYEEAIKEVQKAIDLSQPTPRLLASLGYLYAVSGKAAKALEVKAQLQQSQAYVSPYHLALLEAGLGRKDAALNLLEQAYEERFGLLVYLGIEPRFDSLRDSPRFASLLRRVGLSE